MVNFILHGPLNELDDIEISHKLVLASFVDFLILYCFLEVFGALFKSETVTDFDASASHEVAPCVIKWSAVQDQFVQMVELLSCRLFIVTERLDSFPDELLHLFVWQDKLVQRIVPWQDLFDVVIIVRCFLFEVKVILRLGMLKVFSK